MRRSRFISETSRQWTSVGVIIAAVVVAGVVLHLTETEPPSGVTNVAINYFGAWTLYCVTYFALTMLALKPLSTSELGDALAESDATRRKRKRSERWAASGGTSGAVSFCAIAIGAVISAAMLSELRSNPVVVVLAVLVVATSWLLIVTVYALLYARENIREPGLEYAGAEDPAFSDYWYTAMLVSTSLSTADVTVTTRAMRREVTAHSCVAFVFNTVTIALLISLLLTLIA